MMMDFMNCVRAFRLNPRLDRQSAPIFCDTFLAMLSTCFCQLRELSSRTPRYFAVLAAGKLVPLQFTGMASLCMLRTWLFLEFRMRLRSSSQSATADTARVSAAEHSVGSRWLKYKPISSANCTVGTSPATSGMPRVYTLNKIGPKAAVTPSAIQPFSGKKRFLTSSSLRNG